jgi:UPF0716 protein FxsA
MNNLRSGSRFPRYYVSTRPELIQWLAPNSRRRSLEVTIDDPGRHANIVVGTRSAAMSLVKWGFIALFALPVAELAAFVVLISVIGWFWTLCLFVATTVLGLVILRRSGRRDVDRFRDALRRDGLQAVHLESPGVGPVLGGILLVFPGFITDLLGLLLLVPTVRRRLRARFARVRDDRRRQRDTAVIDLTPKEWHQVSEKPPRGTPKRVP